MLKTKRNHARDAALFSILVFLLVVMGTVRTQAQKTNYVFLPGETITYGAYYNWHFFWVNAGEVTFAADTVQNSGSKQWYFSAIGKTYKAYDLFYTVRDTFESKVFFDSFEPIYFSRRVNHGKSSTIHSYWFNPNSKTIQSFIKREDQPPFRDTLPWKPTTADMLSTVYSFRAYDFNQLKKGEQVNFKMLVDNTTEDLYFRYEGKEVVKTRNGKKFRCHHVVIQLLGGDFFPDGEHMNVWFTADQNHIPVKVETEILIGSVSAILTGLEHIKYPLTSEIK